MAIVATVPSASTANSGIWILNRVNFNLGAQTLDVQIIGYVSNAARIAGASALDTRFYSISGASYTQILSSGTLALSIENWIIANDAAFTGGVAS